MRLPPPIRSRVALTARRCDSVSHSPARQQAVEEGGGGLSETTSSGWIEVKEDAGGFKRMPDNEAFKGFLHTFYFILRRRPRQTHGGQGHVNTPPPPHTQRGLADPSGSAVGSHVAHRAFQTAGRENRTASSCPRLVFLARIPPTPAALHLPYLRPHGPPLTVLDSNPQKSLPG